MKKLFTLCAAPVLAAVALAGCSSPPAAEAVREETVTAAYAGKNFKADAQLSDPAWQKATEYKLHPIFTHGGRPEKTRAAIEKTKHWHDVWAKVLHDEENIYIGVRFENDDIRALSPKDQEFHYEYGDTLEVFIKPKNANAYFELYMTPSGNKTTLFFPSRALTSIDMAYWQKLLPITKVMAKVDGTLNDGSDTDKQWTGVMVISKKGLEKYSGVKVDEKNPWTILISGYGYSQNQVHGSWFSYPRLPQLNYHIPAYYAPLILENK